MNDETKQLFKAPWRTTDEYYVKASDNFYVCQCRDKITANRIKFLPELFDALNESIGEYCKNCNKNQKDYPCVKCKWFKSIQLLKKVVQGI